MSLPTPVTVRRQAALAALTCLAVSSAAGLTISLISCAPPDPAGGRALTAAEAQRLASMRGKNLHDARAGLQARIGSAGSQIDLAGWVDWTRELIYAEVHGPGVRAQQGLLQAVPGLVATRPQAQPAATPPGTAARPPATPPADGWQLRRSRSGAADAPLDSLLSLIFALGRERDTGTALPGQARWLGRDRVDNVPVDVVLDPAPPVGQPGPSPVAAGGAVRYRIDADARLRRFDAPLPGGLPAQVHLDRADRPMLPAIDDFGGAPVTPRAVTSGEATLLSLLRQRNRYQGGARVSLRLPQPSAADLAANGWIDWREGSAYLLARDGNRSAVPVLLLATRNGIATRAAPPGARGNTSPPLPPPSERAWAYRPWEEEHASFGGPDLDLLISEALAAASASPDDVVALRACALWLRTDTVDGIRVSVFEIAKAADGAYSPHVPPRLRYWVDSAGLLRRLQLHTAAGAYAQLDLEPGDVPFVGTVPLA